MEEDEVDATKGHPKSKEPPSWGRGGTDKSAWYLGRPEGQMAVIDAHVVVRCRQLWQGADLQRDVCELREAEGGGCNVFEVDALVLCSQ